MTATDSAFQNGFQLRPETFSMALSLGGRPAGEMAWSVAPDKHFWAARVQTDFGGVLPELRRVQTSRVQPRTLLSLGYAEGDGKRATFETIPDRRAGLLTVRQGRDEASAPLLSDLHDPVSLLLWLRGFEGNSAEALMAGGRVHVRRLPDAELGSVQARAFELRPGGALVYVEDAPPRRLLRLVQPTDFGPVLAELREERARGRENSRRRGR